MSLSKKDKAGVALIVSAVVVMVVVIVGTAILQRRDKAERVDPDTLCPYSRNYAHTVVIVDKTDPFSDNQKKKFRALVLELRGSLEIAEKLSIYVLDDRNYLAPRPVFAVCNPGTGSAANPFYQNPRMWEKRFHAKFGKPLDDVVGQLDEAKTTKISPILEMVHSVAQVFDFGPAASNRRLIVFSDLMQNVPEFSHFNSNFDYKSFRSTPYAKKVKADLTDAKVRLIYLLRPELHKFQSQPAHQTFWGNWFQDSGAKEVVVERAP
jgi:hypothetical protein